MEEIKISFSYKINKFVMPFSILALTYHELKKKKKKYTREFIDLRMK